MCLAAIIFRLDVMAVVLINTENTDQVTELP